MGYVHLIPSLVEYAEKFKQLDSLDFKIIQAMCKHGISNLSRVAEAVRIPQQTISYRVSKFDKQDLVRFRALIDEPRLGLKSYAVLATNQFGKEEASSFSMTCFPLWRYLAIFDGWKRGNYVRYAIPPNKERDLGAFLNELRNRELIEDFEILPTTGTNYPLLNLDFYMDKKSGKGFNWTEWVAEYDSYAEAELKEPRNYDKAEFDIIDLVIMRCFELDARTSQREIIKKMAKIEKIKDYQKLIPLVSRRIRDRINPQGLIRGCRAYLFPNPGPTVLLFMFYISFSKISSLRKFVSGISQLPYNVGFEKILGKDALFVRFAIPVHECQNLRKALIELANRGHIKDSHFFMGDLTGATWDNVEIYQMFKNGAWNFSYGAAMKMLEKVVR